MGLGTLLLNTDEIVARLRRTGTRPWTRAATPEPSAGSQPAATAFAPSTSNPAAPTTPLADFQLTEDADKAEFVMLWPALGCPELVDPEDLSLEIIFFSKKEASAVDENYIRGLLPDILVLEWDSAKEPYKVDGCSWNILRMNKTTLASLLKSRDSIAIRTKPMALDQYRSKVSKQPLQLGELYHTMADVVPKAYHKKCFKSIVSVRLTLQMKANTGDFKLEPDRLYTLFYGPENGVLRGILLDFSILERPYDDIPLMKDGLIGGHNMVYGWRHDHKQKEEKSRCGDRKREHGVRLFHPFSIVREQARKYLNVGHLTDLHVSTLWDYFDEKIFPSYKQDKSDVTNNDGRDPRRDADSLFEAIADRYNNPNLNVRNLTYQLNRSGRKNGKPGPLVDILIQTGDILDFNRGFNLNPRHDPDKDYVFNLNWLRYYELLLLDYERPTYTVLGNHDWRLNPYPPRIKAEVAHFFLLLYLPLALAGTGAASGLIWGALEDARDNDNKTAITILQLLLAPLAAPLALFAFATLLGGLGLDLDITFDVLFSNMGLWLLLGGGWLFGLLLCLLLYLISDAKDTASGTLWGTILGATGGGIGFITFFIILFFSFDYMSHIANLLGKDFAPLLDDKNAGYLNAFGKDGLFYMTERSFDWYALVINPFLDYAFRHGNMSFMMADWGGSEILTGNPPVADDLFTDRQWKLFEAWIDWAKRHRRDVPSNKGVIPVLSLHPPVFCPMLDEDLEELHTDGATVGADKIARGTMEERRQALIKRLFRLAQGLLSDGKPIPAISLTGHTHDYDIFHTPTLDKAVWYQREHLEKIPGPGFWNKGLHITTSCAGPPGDGKMPEGKDKEAILNLLKEYDKQKDNAYNDPSNDPRGKFRQLKYKKGDRVPRAAGCRVLSFDPANGNITSIDEISAQTAKWGSS